MASATAANEVDPSAAAFHCGETCALCAASARSFGMVLRNLLTVMAIRFYQIAWASLAAFVAGVILGAAAHQERVGTSVTHRNDALATSYGNGHVSAPLAVWSGLCCECTLPAAASAALLSSPSSSLSPLLPHNSTAATFDPTAAGAPSASGGFLPGLAIGALAVAAAYNAACRACADRHLVLLAPLLSISVGFLTGGGGAAVAGCCGCEPPGDDGDSGAFLPSLSGAYTALLAAIGILGVCALLQGVKHFGANPRACVHFFCCWNNPPAAGPFLPPAPHASTKQQQQQHSSALTQQQSTFAPPLSAAARAAYAARSPAVHPSSPAALGEFLPAAYPATGADLAEYRPVLSPSWGMGKQLDADRRAAMQTEHYKRLSDALSASERGVGGYVHSALTDEPSSRQMALQQGIRTYERTPGHPPLSSPAARATMQREARVRESSPYALELVAYKREGRGDML